MNPITNNKGQVIGFLEEAGTYQNIYDSNGSIRGRYNYQENKTYTHTGSYVGPGNQLMRLINN